MDCFKVEMEPIRAIFESTKYLKIMHGCETDLKVLFTNLNISCVNVFDTSKLEMEIEKSKQNPSL